MTSKNSKMTTRKRSKICRLNICRKKHHNNNLLRKDPRLVRRTSKVRWFRTTTTTSQWRYQTERSKNQMRTKKKKRMTELKIWQRRKIRSINSGARRTNLNRTRQVGGHRCRLFLRHRQKPMKMMMRMMKESLKELITLLSTPICKWVQKWRISLSTSNVTSLKK